MQLFLTSVSDGVKSIDYLKEAINERTQLVVLPLAHDFKYISCSEDIRIHYDRNYLNEYSIYWRTVRPFIDIGINPDRINVIDVYSDPIELIKMKLTGDNTIVYLPGGFPENIVATLKRFKLTEIIKHCKIVVGESAGSMIWSKRYFVYPDADYKKYKCYKGLKLIKDFVILPHYNKDNVDAILESSRRFKMFHREKVYLLEDGGWIWYDTEQRKIIRQRKCGLYR